MFRVVSWARGRWLAFRNGMQAVRFVRQRREQAAASVRSTQDRFALSDDAITGF